MLGLGADLEQGLAWPAAGRAPRGVGIDLVSIAAVAESLEGRHAARYLATVYTAREVSECRKPDGTIDPARLAARFAAKEAAMKVLPGGGEGVRPNAIEVHSDPDGCPRLLLSGGAAELASEVGIAALDVTLAHEAGYAAAAVLAT